MLTHEKILKFYYSIIWTQLLWAIILFFPLAEGKQCPGKCISPQKCKETGGKILAYCTNTKACCGEPHNVQDVCNQNKWNAKTAFFKSPHYPELHKGSLVCQFHLHLFPTTIGVRLDFLDLSMPIRPGSVDRGAHKENLVCDSDMFFIRGFSDWMPDAKCGNLSGQSTVLELEKKQEQVSLLFVMSSDEYKWNIKLTQISSKDVAQTEKCWKKKMKMWNNEIGEEYQYHYDEASMNSTSETDMKNKTMKLNNFLSMDDEYSYPGDFIGPLPLILDGEVSRLEEIPWQISIQKKIQLPRKTSNSNSTNKKCKLYTKGDTRHNCGATIIGERHILTASHCVMSREPLPRVYQSETLKVHVGDYDFCSLNETSNFKIHEVESIIFHFNYIVPLISNDLAVIKLKTNIKFGKTVRPIPLAPLEFDELEYENTTNLLLTGWGNTQKGRLNDPFSGLKARYPTTLMKTTKLTVQDLDECLAAKYYELAGIVSNGTEEEVIEFLSGKYAGSFSKFICTAGVKDGTPSYGDSGGPLVALDENWKNPYLVGVVSHLEEFSSTEGGKIIIKQRNYYVKVTSYLNWIYMTLDGEC